MLKFQFILHLVFTVLLYFDSSSGEQAIAIDPKCLHDMDPGPCRMSLDRFYYNSKTNTCDPFKFGGCKGNDNKFGFLKTCEDACLQPNTKTTTATTIPTTKPTTSPTSEPQPIKQKKDVL